MILTVIDDLASVGCASRYIGATHSRERNLNVQRWPFAIYAMTMRNKLVVAGCTHLPSLGTTLPSMQLNVRGLSEQPREAQ